jgi:2-polyprenyl-6-methoxyphenol hydroxylase-like FAD-dependent oxidoreductase
MSHTIVLGGGLCGLSAAMMLARDGHRVTVLERDPAPLPENPEAAWERWRRDGVTQFRQAHYLLPLGRGVLEAELPDVLEAFKAAGAYAFDPITQVLGAQARRPDDDRFATWTGRRSTLEWVVVRAAEREPGVDLRRGVSVTALETRRVDGRMRVTAVRTDAGDRLVGDLVVDAMGRASNLPRLLAAAGGDTVHEEAEDTGFLYYTRHFRGDMPAPRGPINAPVGTFSILTLPADNGTWSITLYGAAGDRPLKALRDPAKWTALVRACPLHAHWLDGEPFTPVMPMGGVVDRLRSSNGAPPPLGLVSLGDAWACTNPSMGRGMSLGLKHAALLRRAVREHDDVVAAFTAATEAELRPWYDSTVLVDRSRMAEIIALRDGKAPVLSDHIGARIGRALGPAMTRDGEVFRGALEISSCLSLPREVFARPGFAERVFEAAADAPPSSFGPHRETLLTLLR